MSEVGISFLEALTQRYGAVDATEYDFKLADAGAGSTTTGARKRPVIEKHWEMVGMEQLRKKQMRHQLLNVLVLNTCNITVAERDEGEILKYGLSRVVELDLANNPGLDATQVDCIVRSLPALKDLQLNDDLGVGPTLTTDFIARTSPWPLTTIALNRTYVPWDNMVAMLTKLPHLVTLHLVGNRYDDETIRRTTVSKPADLPHLTELNFSENSLRQWDSVDLLLSTLLVPSLKILSLNENALDNLPDVQLGTLPTLRDRSRSISTLGLFANQPLNNFPRFHELSRWFPALCTLRVSYAPLFEAGTAEPIARMLVIASLNNVTMLNNAVVRSKERLDAELLYIQRATAVAEDLRASSFPVFAALKTKHAAAVIAPQQTHTEGPSALVRLKLRNDVGAEMERSLPTSLTVAKLKSMLAAMWPHCSTVKQRLSYFQPLGGDSVPMLIPLDNDFHPLSFFGVTNGCVIQLELNK